jgi:HD-GYP domain-containing protein (c-di-GMP phosphodiesterase class II)
MRERESSARIVLSGFGPHLDGLRWENASVLRIGRRKDMEIVVDDPTVSPQHAAVAVSSRGWMIQDMQSASGTFLNGIPLTHEQKLQLDDVIHCGRHALKVTVLEEPMRRSPASSGPSEPNIKTTGPLMTIQAVTQRSWEEGLQELSQGTARPNHGKHLFTLLRAGHHLSRVASLQELLQSVLNDTVTVLEAEQGAILLIDESTGVLQSCAYSSIGNRASVPEFSTTLATRCFSRGESLLCTGIGNSMDIGRSHGLAKGNMNSIICALLRSPRQRLGVLHLHRGLQQEPFGKEELHMADAVAASVSVGVECSQMIEKQRQPFFEKITAFVGRAVELRDPHTGKHNERVQAYAMLIAEKLALPQEECRLLKIGAGLHDLGKIVIADSLLHKPGKLSSEEFDKMRQVTLKGVALAETFPDLAPVLPIIRSHHERWDGTGYPDGLKGKSIPHLARIVAIANAFDAMTADQPYRAAFPLDQALAELKAGAGSQFDPALVEVFLWLRPRLELLLTQGSNGTSRLKEKIGTLGSEEVS